MSAPSETAFFGVDEINLMRSGKRRKKKKEREKTCSMLSGSWGSLRAVSSRYGTFRDSTWATIFYFYSTLSQKWQEDVLVSPNPALVT